MRIDREAVKNVAHSLQQGMQIVFRGYNDQRAANWRAIVNGAEITPEAREQFKTSLYRAEIAAKTIGDPFTANPLDLAVPPTIQFNHLTRVVEVTQAINDLSEEELDQRMRADALANLQRHRLIDSLETPLRLHPASSSLSPQS